MNCYTGFVPEKNLKEIEKFRIIDSNHLPAPTIVDFEARYPYLEDKEVIRMRKLISKGANVIESYGRLISEDGLKVSCKEIIATPNDKMLICAPSKDMDTKGMKSVNGIFQKVFKQEFPDPVVLQPVKGGFLIITMWADETFDPHTEPLLINEKLN